MRRLFFGLALLATLSCVPTSGQETLSELCDRVFSVAQVQAVYMDSLLTAGMPGQAGHDGTGVVMAGTDRPSVEWLCPRTFQGDTLVTSDIGWWTSGFYPGVLWQIYEETADARFRELAVKHTLPLAGLLDQNTDHDIGFQLMSSFGKMMADCHSEPLPSPFDSLSSCHSESRSYTCHSEPRSHTCHSEPRRGEGISPDSVLRRGAAKLAARFVPEAGVIRSWNWGPWNIPVIIDNMMNLELLDAARAFPAIQNEYWEIAETHARTTLKNHFREDGTVWHLVDYADDGTVLGRQTVQGYADDTAWARGQAWALYGYARMAEVRANWAEPEVHFQPFYAAAAKLEAWLLENLPEDGVPYWDFSQSDYKDASAGAIIACGLLKMWRLRDCPTDDPALAMAERILRTLASPEYLAEPRTNGGFLLKHSVGNIPGGTEVDVPLTYADYYFLEALTLLPAEGRGMEAAEGQ